LAEYCTSEKDIKNGNNKMPNDEFVVDTLNPCMPTLSMPDD